jgi:DNA-binding NtrC family response regulator
MNLIAIDDEYQLKIVYEYMFNNMFGDKVSFHFFEDPAEFVKNINDYAGKTIVFTDINMPQIDGFLLTEKIMEMKPDWNVFLVSARDPNEYLEKAKKLKVKGYFMKPLDFDVVRREIEKFL